jgi:peptidoglycan hydrolase-like protein with peptidoglycan-binding domain
MAKKVKRKAKAKSQRVKQTSKSTNKAGATKIKPAKVFVYALALAALGGGGYLVYNKLKRKKLAGEAIPSSDNSDAIIINNSLPASTSTTTARLISSASDSFPLKRGSRGTRVTQLQQALARTTPGLVIDGQFGIQTASALKAAGFSETVDETLFNKITGSSKASLTVVFNPAALALSLYTGAQAKNIVQVLSVLKQMKTVSEYSAVNEYYKKQSFISKTIVTDLLEYAFKGNETAKAQIKNEFLRMGLKVSSTGAWSLQGIRLYKDLITIRDTVVIDNKGNRIPVRRNTILGDEVEVANGMTWFKSIDNSTLKVPTQDVKYT